MSHYFLAPLHLLILLLALLIGTPAYAAIVPNQPTIDSITPGNGQATINFTRPVNNGVFITGYIATCGTSTATGTLSPIIITGLTNGTLYNCTILATSVNGAGFPSDPLPVTPSPVEPDPPTIVSAIVGNGQTVVSFTAPNSDGGSPITGYSVTCDSFSKVGVESPIIVLGTPYNPGIYPCTVTATNAVGSSVASTTFTTTRATLPLAPSIFSAIAGNAQITLTFVAINDGGSSIIDYTATCSPISGTGNTVTIRGTGSTITVTGLSNGSTYTCTVRAWNFLGGSQPSTNSSNTRPQGIQSIVFDPVPTMVVGESQTLSATGGASGNAITYSITTTTGATSCSVVGNIVKGLAAGTCTIIANQAGNNSYAAATPVTRNIAISKADQTITFTAQGEQTYGISSFTLNPLATASSGLAVTYTTTTPSVCSIGNATVTIVAGGTCTIAANQAGNATYSAAPQITQNITISKASQTISFGTQTGKTFGASPFKLNPLATASSKLAITYTSTTPLVCTITDVTVTLLAGGACTIAANQLGNSNYNAATPVTQNIAIGQLSQKISFPTQAENVFGAAPFNLNPLATASSKLAVTYTSTTPLVCTISDVTVTIVGGGTCTIAANQTGDVTYSAAPQTTQDIKISPATQIILFGPQTAVAFGTTPFKLNPLATASSGLPVTYTSTTPSVCTISDAVVTLLAASTCTVIANQAGNDSYAPATPVARNIAIAKAGQTITFAEQDTQAYGSSPFALNPLATSSSGLAVTYTSTTPSVCTISDATVSIVTGGACAVAANQAGNTTYSAAPQVTQNITISKASQTIFFGAQAGKIFGAAPFKLNPLATASSKLVVTYTSTTPSVCTISDTTVTLLSVGTCTISANQSGNGNYNAATSVTQNITFGQLAQKITFPKQAGNVFGTAPFNLNPLASASSKLAVTYTSTTPSVCTISDATVTIVAGGTCIIAANQAGNGNYLAATQVTQSIAIAKATQVITFAPQNGHIFNSIPFVLNPLAVASSGLEVSYSSSTVKVCTLSGITVTALSAGTCTIRASQAGNDHYNAAATATQKIIIGKPTAPAAPALNSIIPGFSNATINFSAPSDNGGSIITVYIATCTAMGEPARTGTASGTASTIIVPSMTVNLTYSCAVTASNSIGTSPPSAALSVMPSPTYVIPTTTSPLTGLWWNADESGWGMSVTQHGPTIFIGWYTYDQTGTPTWYSMSSCPIQGNACTGDIYIISGGKPFVAPWDDSAKVVTKVGNGILVMLNDNTGVFSFTINGLSGSKSITRSIFATGLALPVPDFSDLWWSSGESGWGVALTQQNETIFATLFGYDEAGNSIWYVASNCKVSGTSCSGDLYQTAGGTNPFETWDVINLALSKVGFVEFAFTDSTNGVMNFFINGASGSKAITRLLF